MDAFRHWLSVCENASDVLSMAKNLIPTEVNSIDAFIVDELNHACIFATKYDDMSNDNILVEEVAMDIVDVISNAHPFTAKMIRELF